jgi:siroheme synthase
VRACEEADVPITIASGVTDVAAALAASWSPARPATDSTSIISVTVAPTHRGDPVDWTAVARRTGVLVLLGALPHLADVAATLVSLGRAGTTPVQIVSDATAVGEQVVAATHATAADVVGFRVVSRSAVVVVDPPARDEPRSAGGGPAAPARRGPAGGEHR